MSPSLRFVVVAVIVASLWFFVLPSARVAQPIAFNHVSHRPLGCTVCHRGAETGVRAGIPQGRVCANCHATPPGGVASPAAWAEMAGGRPIPWIRLARVPDHVAFSHRRHATLGRLGCASCHGEMTERRTPPAMVPVSLTMDACFSCHRREGVSEDCAACHR